MSIKQVLISLMAMLLIGFPVARILYIIYDKGINKILMLASLCLGIELLILTFGRKE